MLPDDQRGAHRKNSEGCDPGAQDKFRWAEEGVGRIAETVQGEAGRVGEVEGLLFLPIHLTQ